MRAIVVLLVTGLVLTACTGDPEAAPPTPPTPAATSATPTETAIPAEPASDRDLGMALPNTVQIGQMKDYRSCIAGDELCARPDVIGAGPDPTLSWVRAYARGRWAQILVSRQQGSMPRSGFIREAKLVCPRGDWSHPGDPRGFNPRPPTAGTSQRVPVDAGGFRGLRCAMESGPVGEPRRETHWIRAARDDIRLEVSTYSPEAALRLFEEYVDRLDES